LEVKIFFKPESSIIIVTSDPFHLTDTRNTKKKRTGLGTKTKTLIKKAFLEVTKKSYKKLKVVGVGFRVSYLEFEQLNLLKLEIGYSHSVYFRIPNDVFVLVTSSTNFIVSGASSDRVCEIASKIRKLKLPEVYKGKGILYENEVVLLKKVKKQ
jgi:large subunit ribosomal protein L6